MVMINVVFSEEYEDGIMPMTVSTNHIMMLDPDNLPDVPTTAGEIPASIERTIAHELGHVIGYEDGPPLRMSNVNANENPVAEELGQPRRTAY